MPWYCAVHIEKGERVYCGTVREEHDRSEEIYVAEATSETEAAIAAEMGAACIRETWDDR